MMMHNQFVIFVTFHTLQVDKWQHFKSVVEMLHVSCSKFSQLSNSEKK